MEKEKDEILNEETEAEKAEEQAAEATEEAKEEAPAADEKDELQEANEKYLRLAAEYQNFRRRTEEEKVKATAYANERIVKDLLDVADNFERALSTAKSEDESFKNGIDLIYKQFMTVLKNFGVEPVEAEGKEFDPNFHNAVMAEEVEGTEAGIVLMELQKGYMLKDRVVRPSMVKVSS